MGKGKSSSKIFGGYVSFLEGITFTTSRGPSSMFGVTKLRINYSNHHLLALHVSFILGCDFPSEFKRKEIKINQTCVFLLRHVFPIGRTLPSKKKKTTTTY